MKKEKQAAGGQPDISCVHIDWQADNYGKRLRYGKEVIPCYSRKQLRAFHPGKTYTVAAECLWRQASALRAGRDDVLYAPCTFSRWRYRERGYWRCADDKYVAILAPAAPRLCVVVGCCLLAAALILPFHMRPKSGTGMSAAVVDPNALEFTTAAGLGEPDAANIDIPGYTEMKASVETGELDVILYNPEENPCYFVISLLVEDKTLYQSGLLPPGKALYHPQGDASVPEGDYKAVLQYYLSPLPFKIAGDIVLLPARRKGARHRFLGLDNFRAACPAAGHHKYDFGHAVVNIVSCTGNAAVLRFELLRRFIGQLFTHADALADAEHTVYGVADLDIEKLRQIADGKLVLGIQHMQQPFKIFYGLFSPMLQF